MAFQTLLTFQCIAPARGSIELEVYSGKRSRSAEDGGRIGRTERGTQFQGERAISGRGAVKELRWEEDTVCDGLRSERDTESELTEQLTNSPEGKRNTSTDICRWNWGGTEMYLQSLFALDIVSLRSYISKNTVV